ncbi:MAG: hypothetical protein KME20_04295 [Kaiparowitsia implicata GSE-PSE-MK54-09C]|nr:hypothetical protein [Kaiparowitsia implicata GSE-PSE-MK54-09C]
MTQPFVQLDPLNSPFPIPWSWVQATQSGATQPGASRLRYYRTPALVSPTGDYAAYSRFQMRVEADFAQSCVSSVLFVENLRNGELQTVTAESPFADNPFSDSDDAAQPGTIAMLLPIAWSETGDRILAREFESRFGSGLASDFAVVWHRATGKACTFAPSGVQYSNAILLGWSQVTPQQVLFQAGMIGDMDWPLWRVDANGTTTSAPADKPIVFGSYQTNLWVGPQAHR